MDDLVLARAIHVTAVVFWIGSVGFVTWVVMPALRASERPVERLARFHQIEDALHGKRASGSRWPGQADCG